MAPIRKGDGTGFTPKGFAGVRKGDGTILYSAEPAIPDSGVARWTFDNKDINNSTLTDVWGNNDVTLDGVATGVAGANVTYSTEEAVEFDGSNDVAFADPFNPTPSNSQAYWINGDTTQDSVAFVTLNGDASSSEDNIVLTGYFGSYHANILDNQIDTGIDFRSGWHHICWTLSESGSDTNINFYIDGLLEATDSISVTVDETGGRWNIGAESDDQDVSNLGNFYKGKIDDIRIYSKTLSGNEVSNLYNNGRI